MEQSIRTAGGIEYIFTRKRVKNINMRVHADGMVTVSAPMRTPLSSVDEFVLSKADFIQNAREKLSNSNSAPQNPHEYVSGEQYMFLGKRITLDMKYGEQDAYLDGGVLHVSLINIHNYAIRKKAVGSFFDTQCKSLFTALIDKYYPAFETYGISYPTLRIKDMKSRWGSCIPSKGVITLNSRLIAMPVDCIEYVVVHEYCHFLEPNHSSRFYEHVARYIPDWKERRKRLNNAV